MYDGKILATISTAALLTAAGALLSPEQVLAQNATAQNTGAPTGGAENAPTIGELQEVVVTAEIRAANPQTTPISLSVVTGADLASRNQVQISDLQLTVPDFGVDIGGTNNDVTVRGIGLPGVGATAGVTPGVAVMRDNLFEDESVGATTTTPMYDIASVTVLKGPQGTFIGASAPGGAVQITSQNPRFGTGLSGYIEGLLGNYSDQKLDGAVNFPFGETFAARLAFNVEQRGSFYKDIGEYQPGNVGSNQVIADPGNVQYIDARASFLWKPTSALEFNLKIENDVSVDDGIGDNINPATLTDPVTHLVRHNPFYQYYLGKPFVMNGYHMIQKDRQVLQFNALQVTYTLPDDVQLRSITGYQNLSTITFNQSPAPIPINSGFGSGGVAPNPYYSQELDVISPTTWRVNYIAGAWWFYRATSQDNNSANYLPPYSVANPQVNTTITGPYTSVQRIAGLFGQVSWQISQAWQLQIGARENWDNNYNFGIYQTIIPSPPAPVVLHQIHYNIGHFSDSVPTGKVGVNFTPRPGQYFYAFYARGYKSGGVSTSGPNFGPEHVDDYELGWKGTLLGGHLQTDVGGFYMNYSNMQESVLNPLVGTTELVNVTSPSKISGIEASMQSRLGQFGFNVDLSYLHSAMGSLTAVDSGLLPASANGLGQCLNGATPPACFDYTPYYVTLSGEPNNLSPEWTGNVSLNYNIAMGEGVLTPELIYEYTSRQYASIFQENDYYLMRSHGELGANLTYVNGPWTVQAFGQNLGNTIYEEGNHGTLVYYGNPRQFGVRVQRTF
jgi:iron complex outermembrane receptor protein